jgi:hypothetical protein
MKQLCEHVEYRDVCTIVLLEFLHFKLYFINQEDVLSQGATLGEPFSFQVYGPLKYTLIFAIFWCMYVLLVGIATIWVSVCTYL